jgi:hypothetical protein
MPLKKSDAEPTCLTLIYPHTYRFSLRPPPLSLWLSVSSSPRYWELEGDDALVRCCARAAARGVLPVSLEASGGRARAVVLTAGGATPPSPATPPCALSRSPSSPEPSVSEPFASAPVSDHRSPAAPATIRPRATPTIATPWPGGQASAPSLPHGWAGGRAVEARDELPLHLDSKPPGLSSTYSPQLVLCFSYCMCMFHVFRLFQKNVARVSCACCKIDPDVAIDVANISHTCCKCFIQMLHCY